MGNKPFFVLGLLLTFGLGPALAQESGSSSATDSTTAKKINPKQKMSYATDLIGEMRTGLRQGLKLYDAASKEGDNVKLQCMKGKIESIKALIYVSERAEMSMQEAFADGANDRADHEFRKIAVANAKVRQLVADAEYCMGEIGAVNGITEVEVNTEGITDSVEEDEFAEIDPFEAFDPPPVSPFE